MSTPASIVLSSVEKSLFFVFFDPTPIRQSTNRGFPRLLRFWQAFKSKLQVGSGVRFDSQGLPVVAKDDPVIQAAKKTAKVRRIPVSLHQTNTGPLVGDGCLWFMAFSPLSVQIEAVQT